MVRSAISKAYREGYALRESYLLWIGITGSRSLVLRMIPYEVNMEPYRTNSFYWPWRFLALNPFNLKFLNFNLNIILIYGLCGISRCHETVYSSAAI